MSGNAEPTSNKAFDLNAVAVDERVLADPDVADAIEEFEVEGRGITAITALANVSVNELVMHYHNFFSPHTNMPDPQESAQQEIDAMIRACNADLEGPLPSIGGEDYWKNLYSERLVMHHAVRQLNEDYGPYATWGLVRELERWQPPARQ